MRNSLIIFHPPRTLVPNTADRGSGVGQMSSNLKTKGVWGGTSDYIVYVPVLVFMNSWTYNWTCEHVIGKVLEQKKWEKWEVAWLNKKCCLHSLGQSLINIPIFQSSILANTVCHHYLYELCKIFITVSGEKCSFRCSFRPKQWIFSFCDP